MRILRLPAVRARTGLSRATIYRRMECGKFPRPVKLTDYAVGWLETDIDAWILSLTDVGASTGASASSHAA